MRCFQNLVIQGQSLRWKEINEMTSFRSTAKCSSQHSIFSPSPSKGKFCFAVMRIRLGLPWKGNAAGEGWQEGFCWKRTSEGEDPTLMCLFCSQPNSWFSLVSLPQLALACLSPWSLLKLLLPVVLNKPGSMWQHMRTLHARELRRKFGPVTWASHRATQQPPPSFPEESIWRGGRREGERQGSRSPQLQTEE